VSCNFGLKSYFVISNRTSAMYSFDFEITHLWFQTKLHSTQFNCHYQYVIFPCKWDEKWVPVYKTYTGVWAEQDIWVIFYVLWRSNYFEFFESKQGSWARNNQFPEPIIGSENKSSVQLKQVKEWYIIMPQRSYPNYMRETWECSWVGLSKCTFLLVVSFFVKVTPHRSIYALVLVHANKLSL